MFFFPPPQFYSDYDELEAHFRNEHLLCEHEDCLAKKFVVFNLHSELQQHHTEQHLGNVPRSRRQEHVPVNFIYMFCRPPPPSLNKAHVIALTKPRPPSLNKAHVIALSKPLAAARRLANKALVIALTKP